MDLWHSIVKRPLITERATNLKAEENQYVFQVAPHASKREIKEAQAAGRQLPSNHSPLFAPMADPSLKTGITAEVTLLRDLLKGTPADVKKFTKASAGN